MKNNEKIEFSVTRDRTAGPKKDQKLRLRRVGRRYGEFQALCPTTLDIADGEFLVILGPSGSGKSTLLKLIAGFDHPTCGEIVLDGDDITHTPAHLRKIGMVFQNYALFPHLSVYGNVAFPLAVRGDKRANFKRKVAKALELVGLDGFEKRKIGSMSGGQQQRVALARALVFNPSLLLLDEPLSALDKQLRERMQVELRRIHKEVGATFIGVTHDQREALIMADRVVVMNEGKIEQVGTPAEIYYRPTHRFVAEFVGEITIFEGEVVCSEPCGDAVFGAVRVDGLADIYGFYHGEKGVGGKLASVMVRPERVRITQARGNPPSDSESKNVLEGIVDHVEFSGEFLELAVHTETGAVINAKELTSRVTNDAWRVGEKVRVEWEYADTTILDPHKQSGDS